MIRHTLTLVTAKRTTGNGLAERNHLTLDGNLRTTLCGLIVRSPINHLAPAIQLADCKVCHKAGHRFSSQGAN